MTQYLHTGVNDITAANFHKPSCFYFQFEGTLVTHDFLILLPRTHTGSCQLTVSVLKFDTTCKLSWMKLRPPSDARGSTGSPSLVSRAKVLTDRHNLTFSAETSRIDRHATGLTNLIRVLPWWGKNRRLEHSPCSTLDGLFVFWNDERNGNRGSWPRQKGACRACHHSWDTHFQLSW